MPPTFKMLTLGDSVMWGQGLADEHKFDHLVQAYLAGQGKTVELASLAGSGAIIDTLPKPPMPHTAFLYGELPRTYPSVLTELAIATRTNGYAPYLNPDPWDRSSWKAAKRDLARQVAGYATAPPDLLLVDGGANDFKALQIVLPWSLHGGPPGAEAAQPNVDRILTAIAAAGSGEELDLPDLAWLTEQQLKELIDTFLFERMRGLLAQIGPAFPQSRVIVTGYYPVFTSGSLPALNTDFSPAVATLLAPAASRAEELAALAWALHPGVDRSTFANRVVWQSHLWYEYGTQRLREAVAEANQQFGDRFAVASPAFGPDNGALAPDSLLWTFTAAADEALRELLRLLGGASAASEPEPQAIGAPEGVGQAFLFGTGYALGAGLATDEATAARSLSAFRYYLGSAIGRDDPNATLFGGFTTAIASAGHPNPAGAKVFAAAIEPLL